MKEKFNSKIYAQRALKSLHSDKEEIIEKIYTTNMINAGTDTNGLYQSLDIEI